MLLSSLLFIPLLGILLICAGRSHERSVVFALSASEGDNKTGASSDFAHSSRGHSFNTASPKLIALGTSILNLIISLIIYISFDFSSNQFQFVSSLGDTSLCSLDIGVDSLSLYFVMLTTFIAPVTLLCSWNSINNNVVAFNVMILLLESLLLGSFLALDLLLFYVFFESILPVFFILIGLFGSANRVRAGYYLFLYTLGSSLFMLLSILTISSVTGSTSFDVVFKTNFDFSLQIVLFIGIFVAIGVKTPLYGLNSWLLKAHVESPLGGSVLLAAIVLKLALYGIFRLLLPILPKACLFFAPFVFVYGAITIIYAAFSTLRTTDIKEIIAYSSVGHAAVYLMGAFSNTIQGIEGSILLGLAHGLVSSGLFIIVGGILYDRSGTRNIAFYRGLAQVMPLLSILFFIFILANCGTPLTLNFVGEFLSLYGTLERLPLLGALACTSIVLSAAYSVYLYNRVVFGGSFSKYFKENISDLTEREFFLLFILAFFTVLFGLYPSFILDGLHYSVSSLIYNFSEFGEGDLALSLVGFFSAGSARKSNIQIGGNLLKSGFPHPNLSLNKIISVAKGGCATNLRFSSSKQDLTDRNSEEFIEWFRGFVDGEGSFSISQNKKLFTFTFTIRLHIDDIGVLNHIQSTLGIGKVTTHDKSARFLVASQSELPLIINLFTLNSLNTSKHLNFLAWKKAFELYTSLKNKSEVVLREVETLKNEMNKSRTNFQMIKGFDTRITLYWVLGFFEAEGTVFIEKNSLRLGFSIGQAATDLVLMQSIKNFFESFDGVLDGRYQGNRVVNLYEYEAKDSNCKPTVKIIIVNQAFIQDHLIPLFSSMTWLTKKQLDFEDLLSVNQLKSKGLQYIPEGLELIKLIINQMNSYRLSTSGSSKVDRASLDEKLRDLLSAPSNLEMGKDGGIFIKSLNRSMYDTKPKAVQLYDISNESVIETFNSVSTCAKFLGIPQATASKRFRSGTQFLYKGNLVVIQK